MSLIVKCHIEKIFFALVLLVLFCDEAIAQSRIELRNIQTRKFTKPPAEVANAMVSLAKDMSGSCEQIEAILSMSKALDQMPAHIRQNIPNSNEIKGDCQIVDRDFGKDKSQASGREGGSVPSAVIFGVLRELSDLSDSRGRSRDRETMSRVRLDVEMKPADNGASTIIRLRAFPGRGFASRDAEQIVNSETYSRYFKMLADGLFIDALEIGPAVQE
jgi:hypothetical protein